MLQQRVALAVVVLVSSGAWGQTRVIADPVSGTGAWSVVNEGSFESGTMIGWTGAGGGGVLFATDADSFVGSFSAVTMTAGAAGGPGYGAVSEPIDVTPGERYILSAAMRVDGLADGALYVDMSDISGEINLLACMNVSGWQFAWAPWTANTSSIRLRLIRDGIRGASDEGFFDEIALTPEAEFVPPDSAYTACYADCDANGCPGQLDFFDFLCFQNAFAAGDIYGDCDRSGGLDFFDFLCYQNAFAAGCP